MTISSLLVSLAFVVGSVAQAQPVADQGGAGLLALDGPPPPVPPAVVSRDAARHITMRAVRLTTPLVVDGRLDDEVYRLVPAVADFVQMEPDQGMPATEQTDVWIFFDSDRLYLGARCWDSQPDRIVANEMRRDNQTIQNNDSLTLLLDTFYDRRNGYFFQTNALGALRDQQVTDEGNANVDWNTVWDTKVNRDDKGWTVEMVIPFKSLRYKASGEQVWGVNLRRIVYSKSETSYLSPMPFGGSSFRFSLAGTLVGLEVPTQSRNFEVKPYVRAGEITNRQAVPAVAGKFDRDVGVDAKYGLTKGLSADFTVNTDFAQVEQDEQQVNLTRFNLQFPEKREFFLEGRGIFGFGGAGGGDVPILFFSRQIGLSDGVDVPIRAGARVTGRVGQYTLGLLNIETAPKKDAGAVATNFSVVRVKRDIFRRSAIGLIGTFRPQRPDDAPGSNEVLGVDANLGFFTYLTITGYYARSRTPDIKGNESSYRAQLNYAGDRYGVTVERLAVGEGFNPEIGFLRREAFQRSFGEGRFSPRLRSNRTIRRLVWQGSADYISDVSGRLESREVTAASNFEFTNGDIWSNAFSGQYEFLAQPFRVPTGVVVDPGGYDFSEYRGSYTRAPQHKVAGTFSFSRGGFYDGHRTTAGYNGRLDLGTRLGIEPRVSIEWVDLPAGRFTTKLTSARVGVTISPRMALTALIQYNSSASSLTSNLRFRWEYQPGSDLFIVYSDSRDAQSSGYPALLNRTFVVKATRLLRW